jgi:P-type Mg2+ transporter
VGLTPEFLPMIITVTLGRGAQRMARDQVIVKRLTSIENLGSMDVLSSDKTGTLTQGKIVLETHVDFAGEDSANVLRWACVTSVLETGLRSPLDAAILAHEHPALVAFAKRAEFPFDFDRRRVSVLARGHSNTTTRPKVSPCRCSRRGARRATGAVLAGGLGARPGAFDTRSAAGSAGYL